LIENPKNTMRQLTQLYTADQQCHSVSYSPHDSSLLACVSNDMFGMAKSSSLSILKYSENVLIASKFEITEHYKSANYLNDVQWSPAEGNILLTACSDGSVNLWNYSSDSFNQNRRPYVSETKHTRQVESIQWEPSGMRSYHFLSTGEDSTIKIWSLNQDKLTCLLSLSGHESLVHTAAWNPKTSSVLLSAGSDRTFKLWDVNSCTINAVPLFSSGVCESDVTCCDWNKDDENMFALGYGSGLIELRDFRFLRDKPVQRIESAHSLPVKRIKFSPHFQNLFASISYDLTTKLWQVKEGCLEVSKHHSEFVFGLDFDPVQANRLVDCSWDKRVTINEFEIPDSLIKEF
jgi:peroxin-7